MCGPTVGVFEAHQSEDAAAPHESEIESSLPTVTATVADVPS
jgi:hypothetical protein